MRGIAPTCFDEMLGKYSGGGFGGVFLCGFWGVGVLLRVFVVVVKERLSLSVL